MGAKIDMPSKNELIQLTNKGWLGKEIASEYFVSYPTVNRWFKEYGIKRGSGRRKKIGE